MVHDLLSNPLMAVVVLVVAFILGKVLKLSAKILKCILLVGGAYVIVTYLGIF